MTRTIDLNVDAGESFGAYRIGADEEIMPFVTSVNVACGFHGGDPVVMRRTVRLALAHDTAVGAHPGYPDLQGFGRRMLRLSPEEVVPLVRYQIGALRAIAEAEGATLQHVKAHGALYTVAVAEAEVGRAVCDAVAPTGLILMTLGGSSWTQAARAAGLRVAEEAFIDRGYEADGTLVPRNRPGALITDPQVGAERAVAVALHGRLEAVTGEEVTVRADTLCIHSDTPGAPALAEAVRVALTAAGVRLAPLRDWL